MMEASHVDQEPREGADEATTPMVDVTDDGKVYSDKEKLIPPSVFHDDETHDVPPPAYFEMTNRLGAGDRQQLYDNTCTLVGAVLVTLVCCAPFGIVAIIKAMTARVKHAYGDDYAAKDANRSAKRWILAGVLFGVMVVVIYGAVGGIYMQQFISLQQQQQQQQQQNANQQVYQNADYPVY